MREDKLQQGWMMAGLKDMPRRLASAALLCTATTSLAQVVPPTIPQQPAPPVINSPFPPATAATLPPSTAPAGVQADMRRVLGDDAPFLSGLDVIAGIGLDVSAALLTEYNDNMLRKAANEPLDPGESRADFVFRPRVTLNAGRALGRQQLFVNSTFGWDIYARNEDLNGSRFLLNGGLAWTLGQRCNGRVQGGISTRVTQFDQFAEVIPSRQKNANFLVNATCQTAGGLAPTVSYNSSRFRNTTGETSTGQTVDRSYADSNAQSLTGGIGYTIANRGQVGVQVGWTQVDFPNQPLFEGGTNGTELTNWNLYANYRIGRSLRASGSVGVSNVDPKSELTRGFNGTVWNIGLDYTGPRLGAGISAGRNVSGSNGGESNYQIADFFNGSVNYRLNDRLSFAAGYSRTEQANRGFIGVPLDQVLLDATTERFIIGGDYRLNRIFTFGLDVKHLNRVSRPASFGYDATSVLFAIRASF